VAKPGGGCLKFHPLPFEKNGPNEKLFEISKVFELKKIFSTPPLKNSEHKIEKMYNYK